MNANPKSVSGYCRTGTRRLPPACTAGNKSEIKMPMIVMTVKSSTSVKARILDGGFWMVDFNA